MVSTGTSYVPGQHKAKRRLLAMTGDRVIGVFGYTTHLADVWATSGTLAAGFVGKIPPSKEDRLIA